MIIDSENVKDGESYLITLSDCYGEYKRAVTAKFYKPGSHKNQLKAKYRFVDEYNRIIPRRHAELIESKYS